MKWIVAEYREPDKIEVINKSIEKKIPVFLFMFLEGCGPCNSTKGTWDNNKKLLENKYKEHEFVVARINQINKDELSNIGPEPMGYPSLRLIDSNGKVQEYEESGIQPIDRSSKSFQKWIETSLNKSHSTKATSKHHHRKNISQKAGKWSAKYKKSINCKSPKGFSQKQYCKYGRKRKGSRKTRKLHKV